MISGQCSHFAGEVVANIVEIMTLLPAIRELQRYRAWKAELSGTSMGACGFSSTPWMNAACATFEYTSENLETNFMYVNKTAHHRDGSRGASEACKLLRSRHVFRPQVKVPAT